MQLNGYTLLIDSELLLLFGKYFGFDLLTALSLDATPKVTLSSLGIHFKSQQECECYGFDGFSFMTIVQLP